MVPFWGAQVLGKARNSKGLELFGLPEGSKFGIIFEPQILGIFKENKGIGEAE